MEVSLNGINEFALHVKSETDIAWAHADWAQVEIITADDKALRIGTQGRQMFGNRLGEMTVWFPRN